jgi:hypothetical protein
MMAPATPLPSSWPSAVFSNSPTVAFFLFASRGFAGRQRLVVLIRISRQFECLALLTLRLRLVYIDRHISDFIGIVHDGRRAASRSGDRRGHRGSHDITLRAGKIRPDRVRRGRGCRDKPNATKRASMFSCKNMALATWAQNHGVHRRVSFPTRVVSKST